MENNVDLKRNGKIFPLFILENFKEFRLLPFGLEEKNKDAENVSKATVKLNKYQAFIGQILTFNSPLRNILVYHDLGAGKTLTAINVYNILYNYNTNWNVFVLIKASLKDDPWLKDFKKMFGKDYEEKMKNVTFINYDSPFAEKNFLDAKKSSDATKQNIYIFDEVHNFIRNVYSNKMSKSGKRALVIYDYIIREKLENDTSRVILLTGTPAINEPYEIALMMNLLRPKTFPDNEQDFKDEYIDIDKITKVESIKKEARNRFMRRILGLVSYYIGSDPSQFPSTNEIVKKIPMSDYQKEVYLSFEFNEDKLEKSQTVYKTYTRQSSNFVFPSIGNNVSGETRPRPGKYRISEKEAQKIIEGRMEELVKKKSGNKNELKELMNNTTLYLDTVKIFINSLKDYFNNLCLEDKKNNWTLQDDLKEFKEKYKSKFSKFWKESNKKSKLLQSMYNCSCKYTSAFFYLQKATRPVIIFSNFVRMEGLEIIKIYAEHFGFKNYRDKNSKDYFKYTEFHGEIDKTQRTENIKFFNKIENIDGKLIKIVFISPAGSEGINTKYVEQIHIMEPYWNEPRNRQLIGRGKRYDSHNMLPKDKRHIDIYRYEAIIEGRNRKTTDEIISKLAKSKEKLIDTFLLMLREAAIDCELFKEQNMYEQKYNCFNFNQDSYMGKNHGPAYKEEEHYDKKLDDGLYASNSKITKIKVYKIKAKIELDILTTNINYFWYNPDNGIVYDYDLKYPVGKVKNENGIPIRDVDNNYIVESVVEIPKFINN